MLYGNYNSSERAYTNIWPHQEEDPPLGQLNCTKKTAKTAAAKDCEGNHPPTNPHALSHNSKGQLYEGTPSTIWEVFIILEFHTNISKKVPNWEGNNQPQFVTCQKIPKMLLVRNIYKSTK